MHGEVQTYFVGQGQQSGDETLRVHFEIKQVYDAKASEGWVEEYYDVKTGAPASIKHEAAGQPVYKPTEWVTIVSPGDKDNIVSRPVQRHKTNPNHPMNDAVRFARQYDQFKRGVAQVESGTPLQALVFQVPPIMNETQVAEFHHDGIMTVEALANLSDSIGQNYRGFHQLREKVRRYLDEAKQAAPQSQLKSELAQRDAEIAQLRKALEDQGAMIAKLAGESSDHDVLPRRRGRPPKGEEATP